MSNLLDIATNPEQYSSGTAITWMADDVRQKKQEENFWNAIKSFINTSCKTALDIGCGSGWSADKFMNLGSDWVGLEPASLHFKHARELHPEYKILDSTFENHDTDSRFDCIIAIMLFCHIKDVDMAFKKIHKLLNDGGVFIMMYSVFHDNNDRYERNGRKYDVQIIDENQYVDMAQVGYGIADINRKSEYYIEKAEGNGLKLIKHLKVEDIGYSPKELLVFGKV